jgi:predicted nucleic acid-binding protein
MSLSVPPQLVVDAGPLIAILDNREEEHAQATRGLAQLVAARTRVIVPLPIVFEVFKWLSNETRREVARAWLGQIHDGAVIRYPQRSELDRVTAILYMMPFWRGSMEDALLAVTCERERLPLWTFNYRDLAAFKHLQFWTPGPA